MIQVSNFPNAYKETYTILKLVDEKDLELIPEDFMDMIKRNMNTEYEFDYDPNLKLDEQGVLKETKAILSYIYLHYWATEEQEKSIKEKFRQDLYEEEERKKEQYNVDNIFSHSEDTEAENTEENTEEDKEENFEENITDNIEENQEKTEEVPQNEQLVEKKEESIFKRIINKIKSWFK